MKTIKSILHHWYLYVISLVVAIFVIDYAVAIVDKPRNEETFTLFAATMSYDLSKVNKLLNENKPSYLRELNTCAAKYDEIEDFNRHFLLYGMDNSDIVILPEAIIEDSIVTMYYASFETTYLDDFISEGTYYQSKKDNKYYGVLIHEKGEENTIMTYKDEKHDENYYAFFPKTSKHIGKLNNVSWTTAFDFTEIIRNN